MMLIPRRDNFDLFDDFFNDSFFRNEGDSKLMKTDIIESDNLYKLNIDLPGYQKENVKISVDNGYLVINASKDETNNENDEDGKYIRRERFCGSCTRRFYVGKDIKATDVKATFKNGILSLQVPKKEAVKELPEDNIVQIND